METNAAQRLGPKQQSSTGISTIRLVVTVFIIVACFSALYPKFFHPIVLKMFGVNQPKRKADNPTHPPHRPMPHGGDPRHDDIKNHLRPGPHPGMRAAAEMNKNKQGSSGRGGMMGMVLPVYAFGIIGYLIYTLVKVFGKKDKDGNSPYGRRRGPYNKQMADDANRQPQQQQEEEENKLKGLEDLLSRASNVDPTISADEMRELQKRLEETEKQMSQILSAMQQVGSKVNTVATDATKSDEKDKPNKSSDSSPDISSYEVVDKTKEKNSPESETEKVLEKNSSEVETVKPSETADDKEVDGKKDGKDEKKSENTKDDEEIKDTEEILEDKKEEEESGVRHRKGHPESTD